MWVKLLLSFITLKMLGVHIKNNLNTFPQKKNSKILTLNNFYVCYYSKLIIHINQVHLLHHK